jgi:hypothetical protein
MDSAVLENTRSMYKSEVYFYMPTMNNLKMKLTKVPFIIASKIMKYLEINLTKYKNVQ